ncbi:hypothetical protein CTT31_09370 [Pseudoalteromonas maricaloris]|uniref:DUF3083 family protein n=1 Tax=Pseudoalteromonas maricaloris TaxID=184924 RepID=UPI0021AE137D|nr:DUF3083 family protein [Pseudoalteromonas flavipulchra]USE69318.1 hypothetical protein CTT31_09370 [Pseudoalteromonas flavipulchra]
MASMNLNRVYISTKARNNHYILAEFKPDDAFYACFDSSSACYERLSRQLFALCDEYELHNVHVIANDKLPVVRYHDEAYTMQTEKQILFFYNPKFHEAHQTYLNDGYQARKIRLLFLATGNELRANAATFHNKVKKVLDALKEGFSPLEPQFRVRDHQHLTYDLFAKAKGDKESYGYKLRALYPRYQARNCTLPEEYSEMTYATFNIPVSRAIKTEFQSQMRPGDYGQFYRTLEDAFLSSCADKQLNMVAMVADGRLPIVRSAKIDKSDTNRELQKLSFDTGSGDNQIYSLFNEANLVDTIRFVIVANDKDKKDMGYGRFMNHVETAIKRFVAQLPVNIEKQDVNVRFFQHISYDY